jgi:hypothetical protein
MKRFLAAIAYTQKELELYVSQLKGQGFEPLSEVKKAADGTFYQAVAKTVRQDIAAATRKKDDEQPAATSDIVA